MQKALVIIDPQNDFVGGTLPVPEAGKAMVRLADYLWLHQQDYACIIITQDWHPTNHCSFTKNGGGWPSHCITGSWGADIVTCLQETLMDNECVLRTVKGQKENVDFYSIEGCENWDEILSTLQECDQIDMAGLAGDFCVAESIMSITESGLKDRLVVLTDFIASIDGGDQLKSLIEEYDIKYV